MRDESVTLGAAVLTVSQKFLHKEGNDAARPKAEEKEDCADNVSGVTVEDAHFSYVALFALWTVSFERFKGRSDFRANIGQ